MSELTTLTSPIATSAARARAELSAGAFCFWIMLHFADLSSSRVKLIASCGATRSAGNRHLLELRRKGYLLEETGAPKRLLQVLDASGRCAVLKFPRSR